MPYLDVREAGAYGIVSDLAPSEIPANAWTSGKNARFFHNEAVAFPGHRLSALFPNLSEIWAFAGVPSPTQYYWVANGPNIVGGVNDFYVYNGTAYTRITGPALTGGRKDLVVGDILNNNLVVTNGVDEPQFWPADAGQLFQLLPGWDSTWRCKSIRSFKGFLIAANLTEGVNAHPYRVRWSSQAVPGGMPQSWDETDPAVLANLQDLGQTLTSLNALFPLRDVMLLCSEGETIGMQFIAGSSVFRFYVISRQSGALSGRTMVGVRGGAVILTNEDVVRTDGQAVETIIDKKRREFLFTELNRDESDLAFLAVHQRYNEVWVCIPTQGSSCCNLALTWNWETGAWGERDLPPGCQSAVEALNIIGANNPQWQSASGTWQQQTRRWNTSNLADLQEGFYLTGDETTLDEGARVMEADFGTTYDGTTRTFRVEKLGIRVADDLRFVAHELWPRANGTPCTIFIGSQESPNGPVKWNASRTFDPEVDDKVTFRVTGRYLCVAFETTEQLRVQGFSVKWRRRGSR